MDGSRIGSAFLDREYQTLLGVCFDLGGLERGIQTNRNKASIVRDAIPGQFMHSIRNSLSRTS